MSHKTEHLRGLLLLLLPKPRRLPRARHGLQGVDLQEHVGVAHRAPQKLLHPAAAAEVARVGRLRLVVGAVAVQLGDSGAALQLQATSKTTKLLRCGFPVKTSATKRLLASTLSMSHHVMGLQGPGGLLLLRPVGAML